MVVRPDGKPELVAFLASSSGAVETQRGDLHSHDTLMVFDNDPRWYFDDASRRVNLVPEGEKIPAKPLRIAELALKRDCERLLALLLTSIEHRQARMHDNTPIWVFMHVRPAALTMADLRREKAYYFYRWKLVELIKKHFPRNRISVVVMQGCDIGVVKRMGEVFPVFRDRVKGSRQVDVFGLNGERSEQLKDISVQGFYESLRRVKQRRKEESMGHEPEPTPR